MNSFVVRDVIGWGLGLWLIGYILGVVFFALVPPSVIGWWVMPFGIAATCLVLWRRVRVTELRAAVLLGLGWSVIAIHGYYKLDVYLYYVLTLALPIGAATLRRRACGA